MITRHINILFEINKGLAVGLPFCTHRRNERDLRNLKEKFFKKTEEREIAKRLKGVVSLVRGLQVSAAAAQAFRVAAALGICSPTPGTLVSFLGMLFFSTPSLLDYAQKYSPVPLHDRIKELKSSVSDISLAVSAISSVALIFLGSPLTGAATLGCIGFSLYKDWEELNSTLVFHIMNRKNETETVNPPV